MSIPRGGIQMKKLLYSFTAITCNTLLIWKYTGEYSLKNLILSLVITTVLGGIALFWILGGKLWKQYVPPMPALPDANGRIPTKTGLLIIFGIIFSAGVTVWLLNNIFILIGGVLKQ